MKVKIFIIAFLVIVVLSFLLSPWSFLFVGLWFSPNPPMPEIKNNEFNFELIYKIDGKTKILKDVWICEFDGVNIDEANGKNRKWKAHYKNIQNNELYAWRVEQINNRDFNEYKSGRKPIYNYIVLKNIDNYKVLFHIPDAKTFMGENYDSEYSIQPGIDVYSKETCYFIESEEFLSEHGFEIISWKCDRPIKNTFK